MTPLFKYELARDYPPELVDKIFRRGTPESAGLDLYIPKTVTVQPNSSTDLISLELCAAIPRQFVGLVVPRSSAGKLSLALANTVGVIDSDYRGKWMCQVTNHGNTTVSLELGKAYFQLVIVPYQFVVPCEVEDLDSAAGTTLRGDGGYGSTGH